MKKILADKQKRNIFILSVVIPLLILTGVFAFLAYRSVETMIKGDNTQISDKHKMEEYGYFVRGDATKLQEQLFAEMKQTFEDPNASEEEKAGCVAKNFVADYYTWTNKKGQYDVGGMCYVYEGTKYNFYLASRDEFYRYLSFYIDKYGSENLIEVESIDVAVGRGSPYEIDGEKYELYGAEVKWTYKSGSVLNENKFSKIQEILMIRKENGRFEIVETYSDF